MKYTKEQIMAMSADELDSTVNEIRSRQGDADADLDNLSEAADWIKERRSVLKAEAEKRQQLRDKLAGGEGGVQRKLDLSGENSEKRYSAASPEYRTGFLKSLLGHELSREERSAVDYVGTTTDTTQGNHGMGLLVPTTMLNSIWSLIGEQHAILGDITMYRTNTILSIPIHTAVAQGDATAVNENAAGDDEINNFITVELKGKDFTKAVQISYAMARMGIDALEGYLTNEIATRIGYALAKETIAQILADHYTTGRDITCYDSTVGFKDVANAFAALENGQGSVVVYAKNPAIYKYLVGMVDSNGRPIFQLNAQQGAQGSLIGAAVKAEDALADDTFLIGYPKTVVGNMVQDVMVETDRDIRKHVIVFSGYARYESKLIVDKAFVKMTVTSATE